MMPQFRECFWPARIDPEAGLQDHLPPATVEPSQFLAGNFLKVALGIQPSRALMIPHLGFVNRDQ
ncbi:MAG: hypothetical protein AAGF98_19500 [Cyanobacteria bacterium P01_H01_bin.153]